LEKFSGANSSLTKLKHGEGLYITQEIEGADSYARDFLHHPTKPSDRASVVKVYVKDIQSKKQGVDYTVGTGQDEGTIILHPIMYNDISVKHYYSVRPTPHTARSPAQKALTIRK